MKAAYSASDLESGWFIDLETDANPIGKFALPLAAFQELDLEKINIHSGNVRLRALCLIANITNQLLDGDLLRLMAYTEKSPELTAVMVITIPLKTVNVLEDYSQN